MNKKGFTLVELLAVIVILAVLIGIAVPVYITVSKNIRENTYNSKKEQIALAAIKYANENNVSSSMEFTVTRLVVNNYYEAEKYIDEVPFISNPLNVDDNMACHIVDISIDNNEYFATVSDNADCSLSQSEAYDNKIKIRAFKLASDDAGNDIIGDEINIFDESMETDWVNTNILLAVTLNEELLTSEEKAELQNYSSISYTMAGNTDVKEGNNKLNSFVVGTPINVSSYSNLYKVEASLFLSQDVGISIKTVGNDKNTQVRVRIDKEDPTLLV